MEKTKKYFINNIPVDIIRIVYETFEKISDGETTFKNLKLEINDERWSYDKIEDFFTYLPKSDYLYFYIYKNDPSAGLEIRGDSRSIEFAVSHNERERIEQIFNIIDRLNSQNTKPVNKINRPLSKKKTYYSTNFPVKLIKKVYKEFINKLDFSKNIDFPLDLTLTLGDEEWILNSIDEFFLLLPSSDDFRLDLITQNKRLVISGTQKSLYLKVELDTREEIESIFRIIDEAHELYKIKIASKPIKIFIGHGHDSQWRDLKDHLSDLHGFKVEAYEIGPRAGLSVKEVLEEMLDESSFALLVLTGEDIHLNNSVHARENVIHEVGLFQGRLGFRKAIVLLENGVNEFSNILGINQIRFSKGNIRETFGEVLATIKREFENDN